MKKHNFKKLAALGVMSGLAFGLMGCEARADKDTEMGSSKQLTEQDLLSQLNPDTKKTFQEMSPEGKKLALQLANQSCKGKNDCKGLNSCKSDKNTCMGRGGCKGTSPGPFADKNDAVKTAAMHMAQKRNAL